jgi:hypothetical protein
MKRYKENIFFVPPLVSKFPWYILVPLKEPQPMSRKLHRVRLKIDNIQANLCFPLAALTEIQTLLYQARNELPYGDHESDLLVSNFLEKIKGTVVPHFLACYDVFGDYKNELDIKPKRPES